MGEPGTNPTMSLALRNLVFSVLVPGAGGVIAAGVALYLWCVWGGA